MKTVREVHKGGYMSTISFDGVRISYVGETGAFCLYTWQNVTEMYDAACNGCADLREAEAAVAECVEYLGRMLELMEEVA
jgi:hypothetical protein